MSMRSQLNSVYKFSKAGKVKQLRLGNRREKMWVDELLYAGSRLFSIVTNGGSVPVSLEAFWDLTDCSIVCADFMRQYFHCINTKEN